MWCCFSTPGFPIRTFRNQRLFAPPPDLSQLVTSFFASESQGIHRLPFSYFFLIFFHTTVCGSLSIFVDRNRCQSIINNYCTNHCRIDLSIICSIESFVFASIATCAFFCLSRLFCPTCQRTLSSIENWKLNFSFVNWLCGEYRIRTDDILLAGQALWPAELIPLL